MDTESTGSTIPWQSRVKALIILSFLTQSPECAAHRDWWLGVDGSLDGHPNFNVIAALATTTVSDASIKPIVKTQAIKTLEVLGVDTSDLAPADGTQITASRRRASVTNTVRSHTPVPITNNSIGNATSTTADINLLDDFTAPVITTPAVAPNFTLELMNAPVSTVNTNTNIPFDVFGDMRISAAVDPPPPSMDQEEKSGFSFTNNSSITNNIQSQPAKPNFDVFDMLNDTTTTSATTTIPTITSNNNSNTNNSSYSWLNNTNTNTVNTNGMYTNMPPNPPVNTYNNNYQTGYPTAGVNMNGGVSGGQYSGYSPNNSMAVPVNNSMTSITAQRKVIPLDAPSMVFHNQSSTAAKPGM